MINLLCVGRLIALMESHYFERIVIAGRCHIIMNDEIIEESRR